MPKLVVQIKLHLICIICSYSTNMCNFIICSYSKNLARNRTIDYSVGTSYCVDVAIDWPLRSIVLAMIWRADKPDALSGSQS